MALQDLIQSLAPEARRVYDSLVEKAEQTTGEMKDDATWWTVYLDNARLPDMSKASFQAYLAVLSKAGLYEIEDSYAFGYVLTDKDLSLSC